MIFSIITIVLGCGVVVCLPEWFWGFNYQTIFAGLDADTTIQKISEISTALGLIEQTIKEYFTEKLVICIAIAFVILVLILFIAFAERKALKKRSKKKNNIIM